MDTTETVLAVLAVICIGGQLCLPLIGRWNRRRQAREAREKIALLLEAEADRQMKRLGEGKGMGE